MSEDNVWLHGRREEVTSLQGILLALEQTSPAQAARGAGTVDAREPAGE